LFWYWRAHHNNASSWASDNPSPQTSNGINYGPPTSTEKQDSQDAKSRDLQDSTSTPSVDSSGKKQVSVQIISASRSSIKANVIGVFEDGGTCTATLNKNGQTKTFTSSGISSSNYTQCEPIALTGISDGGWSSVVSYSSNTAAGQSQPLTIN
jgi:hypothetical protein